ncbi:hypothetical protein MUY27_12045 [Mucilaginibacter sp. RS28]|uniref:Uncharacterized protein n=1 Tax=Mucilaginibacter straminoryzae TaxID=2932774 RepID=A0A9X1X8E5_9SPHI|nr:hypothetical protein [Mucilaginibacter straminoryzae]MCJ8210439.1 hypothetical protein [Mucilaginibacter straminoryzae]
MTIGKKFNELNAKEYIFYINNHKKYKDFNTLGLYRSLTENDNLSLGERITIREYAHSFFKKSFYFLQLKDPHIFVKISTLGMELTKADERRIWDDVIKNQQIILKDKRIKHRNFGTYSKHSCPYENCIYRGLMVNPNSHFAWGSVHFDSDKSKFSQKIKSERRRSERKQEQLIINKLIND